ncbi:MAG: 2-amino-4-hydroxy-6-hydroxymethyldihydropteridine diphosphokinase, partial [Selenomonas sp.]|nr:2-amino-4-hydroxy-6-hydroxymethyldihydropteridine diphosphokinase [Selenomonas sp.]
ETLLSPLAFLHLCQSIERELGRVRHEHWGARTIDIDMLLMEGVASDTEELRLPHPYLTERAFVLVPLVDIAPGLAIKGHSAGGWLDRLPKEAQAVTPAAEVAEPFPLKLIACIDEERGLGRGGKLLVRLPEDMARFKQLTMGGVLIMGRKTMESLPGPLAGRRNVVLSRSLAGTFKEGFELLGSIEELWHRLGEWQLQGQHEFWCIGGAEVYKLLLPYTGEVCLTKVAGTHGADAFLPELDGFVLLEQEAGGDCLFEHYVRENCYR